MNALFQIALGLIPAILIVAISAAVRRVSLVRAIPLLLLLIGAAGACSVLGVSQHRQAAEVSTPSLDPSTALELAQAVAQRGDAGLAQALLEQANPEKAQSAQTTLCLARTYALQGNAPAASALYRKVKALDPQADVDDELQAASQAALPGLTDTQAVEEMVRLARRAVDAIADEGDDLAQTARTLSQINECYERYLSTGELDEDEARRLGRRMDSLKEEQPELFTLDQVRLAQLKINILNEDYRAIAQNVDENSSYDELLVVSELYLNGYIRRRDFDESYGQEYARQCAAVEQQVEKLYDDYYSSQSRSVRKGVREYIDSLDYAADNPALVQLKNDLYDYTQTPGAQDSSKVYLQLAKIENDAGNSAGAEQYLTASLGSAGDCRDEDYTQPMYQIIGIIADKDDPERLKDVAGYVDRIITNSSVVEMPEQLTQPAQDPDNPEPEDPEEDKTDFGSYMTDYVSQKRSALNIAQVDPSAFPDVTATLSISTPIPYSDQELAAKLSVRDCGADIPDFTLKQIHYDKVNVLLCCDVSGSMSGQAIADLREAVKLFAGSLENNQRLALVTFSDSVRDVYGFDTDPADILAAADGLGANGGTDMYSACLSAMGMFQPTEGERNVIILLSDGEDNYSRSEDEMYNNLGKAAQDNQVTLYTLGLGSSVDSGYLSAMAGMCGGTYLYVDNSQTLNSFYEYLNGLMFSQYQLSYTAVDTLRTSRQLRVAMTDDAYCQDIAHYSLGGGEDDQDGEDSDTVSPLPGVEISGLDTRLIFKSLNSQEIRLLGSGLGKDLELSLTIKGNVDYELAAQYDTDTSWKVTVPAGVACGVYDLYVKVGEKTAVLDRELTVAIQGEEKSVTFGPYVFTAYSVVHEGDATTLSGLVSMNGWLKFRGDLTLTGDLEGGSVLMSDSYGAYIQYYEGSSQGLASLFAKKNWKLEIPVLGRRTLYNDSNYDPASEDYPVDVTPVPALYVNQAFTLATPGMGLYADRLEVASDAFTTAFPFQDKLIKAAGAQKPFSFKHSITGKLTATQIGVAAEFELGHNEDTYYPVNLGSMPIYFNPAEGKVELDTLEGKFSIDFTIRLAFLGSTDDGLGLKLAWDGSLVPTEVGVNIDHDITTNISGVPVTFSDFYFGMKDIKGSNPLKWTLVGQATASAYKIDQLLPGIGKWFGDVSVCSLKDATVEFSLGQAHLLLKTDFYLLGQIKLANTEIEAGRFDYSCWLLNMDKESMAGMRAKLKVGLMWNTDNCDIDISGSTELVMSNRMLGVVGNGTFKVDVQWWIVKKDIHANGSAVLGMYKDHSNQLVFILKGVASDSRKDRMVQVAWTPGTGVDVQVKL